MEEKLSESVGCGCLLCHEEILDQLVSVIMSLYCLLEMLGHSDQDIKLTV